MTIFALSNFCAIVRHRPRVYAAKVSKFETGDDFCHSPGLFTSGPKNGIFESMGVMKIREMQANQDLILELICNGKTITDIQKQLSINPRTWWETLQQDPLFQERMSLARAHAADLMADTVLTLADDYENPHQGRLKFEIISRYLSWMQPQKFGQKLDMTITQTIDIAGAIERATQRVVLDVAPLQLSEPKNINDLE